MENNLNNNHHQNQSNGYNPHMQQHNAPKTLSILSMVFGISSWILMWIPWFAILSFITPIVAIVLAIVAKGKEGKNGFRTAGLAFGIASIVGFVLLVVLLLLLGMAIISGLGFF